jgi:hypothetical protein
VAVTPRGRALIHRLDEEKKRGLEPALSRLDPDDLKTMTRLLEQISLFLLEEDTGGSGLCLKCGAYCADTCAFHGREGVCPYGHTRCS